MIEYPVYGINAIFEKVPKYWKQKNKKMSLITIKKSHNESDLMILKSKLESEGIQCFMRNEFTTQIMSHMNSFEVELQVSDSDLGRVKEILAEIEKIN